MVPLMQSKMFARNIISHYNASKNTQEENNFQNENKKRKEIMSLGLIKLSRKCGQVTSVQPRSSPKKYFGF
jgi:hypothetical protein